MSNLETQLALRILNRLQSHTIDNPITAEALGAEFGLTRREVMSITLDLLDNRHKVASSKGKKPGLFIARSPAEAFDTAERMKREGLKYLVRAKKLMTFDDKQTTIYEEIVMNEIEADVGIG
jgi:hypothetical protein